MRWLWRAGDVLLKGLCEAQSLWTISRNPRSERCCSHAEGPSLFLHPFFCISPLSHKWKLARGVGEVGCKPSPTGSPSLFSECLIPQVTHQGSFSCLSKRRRLWSCLSYAFIPSGRGADSRCSFQWDALLISGRDLKLQHNMSPLKQVWRKRPAGRNGPCRLTVSAAGRCAKKAGEWRRRKDKHGLMWCVCFLTPDIQSCKTKDDTYTADGRGSSRRRHRLMVNL